MQKFPLHASFSFAVGLVTLLLNPASSSARTNEFRGIWADGWSQGYRTPEQTTHLINDVRNANLNSVIVQMRRRGDNFYNSKLEPKVPELKGAYDPLADILAKAHDTKDGKQRVDVHAWIVTYHIWNKPTPPPQADHPYNRYPQWLMKDFNGEKRHEGQYTFDPGHPEVQQHTFNVCMELITNYPIDGLHFDYIRYGSIQQGYHDVTVKRFNRLYKRTGRPEPADPLWKQFRRDQVTALVRKVYLNAIDARPEVKISGSTIAWSPGVTTDQEWLTRSRTYNDVLQDWRSWMEEGILDINIPMTYFRHHTPASADYYKWSDFIADHRYNRQAVVGPGLYLNTVSNGLHQMRYTRQASKAGNTPDGVSGYVYRTTNNEGVTTDEFLRSLVHPSKFDSIQPPIFHMKASIPDMPWKTAPKKGHLKGTVTRKVGGEKGIDGATLVVKGPIERKLTSDGTGFFGAVDLPPGTYEIAASFEGHMPQTNKATVVPGKVTTQNIVLPKAQ